MALGTDRLVAIFGPEEIELVRYPFLRRNQSRIIESHELTEIIVDWMPPCVRTADAEFLFFSAEQYSELIRFGGAHTIPFKKRVDIWAMILDPFLDTELDEEYRRHTARILEENGVTGEEVERMRRLVGTRMRILTFHTWEWVYLGLYDVLEQMRTLTFTTGWTFEAFYEYASALADRGAVTPSSAKEMHKRFTTEAPTRF